LINFYSYLIYSSIIEVEFIDYILKQQYSKS